jgi:hypothetical protein
MTASLPSHQEATHGQFLQMLLKQMCLSLAVAVQVEIVRAQVVERVDLFI